MRNTIRIFFLFLLFSGIMLTASGQDTIPKIDHRPVELRNFDRDALAEYHSDDDYDYTMDSSIPSGISFWERISRWFSKMLRSLFSIQVGDFSLGKILLYLFVIAGISWAIYRLVKMNATSMFNPSGGGQLDYDISEENIHVLDFEKLLKEAVDTGQYKRAIRLTYLHALKLLSDAEKIHWHPGKTNHEYAGELDNTSLGPQFNSLSLLFDYAWYGEFDINETHFRSAREKFMQLRKEGGL